MAKGGYGNVYMVSSAKTQVGPLFAKLTHRYGSATIPDTVMVKVQRIDGPQILTDIKRENKMSMAIHKCMKDSPKYYFGGLHNQCEYMTVM